MNYLMLISMMKSLITNSSCILLPFLWKSMGYSPFYIGFALFLFVFAGAFSSFLSPKAEKLFGSKPVVYFSMWATFPMMLLFALTYKTHPILSLIILFFFVIEFVEARILYQVGILYVLFWIFFGYLSELTKKEEA